MQLDLITSILRCSKCSGTFESNNSSISCGRCGAIYSISNNVLRIVDSQHYAGSFGFEWKRHARTQLDTRHSRVSEDAFRARTGFCPEQLAGKWVLDVGCGMGRFAEVATRWGANVVGVDLSVAAEVAAENLKNCANFWAIQADVFKLPFALESFDFIYSIGVLHHTPDCRRAFAGLPRFLKPGGEIAVWLYDSYNRWYRMSDLYRHLTTRIPPRLLHSLCQIAGPLGALHHGLRKVPLIGQPISSAINYLLPISLDRHWGWRVLDTFDWYSPVYQSKHTYEEVFRWFEDSGLHEMRVNMEPLALSGHKGLS